MSSIPNVQRAAVLRGPYGDRHSIEEDYPVKAPSAGEVLVRIEASGICAGDVNPRDGFPPSPPQPVRPLVAGHEGIGHVVALGEGVTDFGIGERVGMGWRRSTCRECSQCQSGQDNLCQSTVINGYKKDGTFQEYVAMPSSDLLQIPKSERPTAELAPLLCSGATALAGVRAAAVKAGEWLCVTGAAGGVGSLAVKYALHLGCRVVAVDSEKKRAHCESRDVTFLGFEDGKTLTQRVREATGDGPMGTVVCSGNSLSFSQAIEWSGVGATIVAVGIAMMNIHSGLLMIKGLKIIGQCNGSKQDIMDALALGREGLVPQVELVALSSIDNALDRLKAGTAVGRQVLKLS